MNPIVVQALTIAGVLLGSATERTRWRRGHSPRWDDRRLAAYADYANAIKQEVRLSIRIPAARKLVTGGQAVWLSRRSPLNVTR